MSIPKLEIATPQSIRPTQRYCNVWTGMRRLKRCNPLPLSNPSTGGPDIDQYPGRATTCDAPGGSACTAVGGQRCVVHRNAVRSNR
jgi:hypothetical protein